MRQLKTNKAFDKKLAKYLKKYPEVLPRLSGALKSLQIDILDPSLNTHKLKGEMKDFYSCSINHSHRICFRYDDEYVYLETIGSHDEVY